MKKKESHFDHARRIVASWPKWKKQIGIRVPNSQFDIDGNSYTYKEVNKLGVKHE